MSGHTATPIGWIVRIKDVKCFYWEREVAEWKAGEFQDQHGAAATIDPVFLADSRAELVKALQEIADTDQYPDSDDTAAELREIARTALATLTARKVG